MQFQNIPTLNLQNLQSSTVLEFKSKLVLVIYFILPGTNESARALCLTTVQSEFATMQGGVKALNGTLVLATHLLRTTPRNNTACGNWFLF